MFPPTCFAISRCGVAVLDYFSRSAASYKAYHSAGKLSAACGRAALDYVRTATLLALHREVGCDGHRSINKEAVVLAGVHFTGHTEYIAELCGAADSRMLLINDRLRVVHVTTHCSLRQACEPTIERILRTIELGHESLQLLGFQSPRIAVCGLNPHAGENGLFGQRRCGFDSPGSAGGPVCWHQLPWAVSCGHSFHQGGSRGI